MDPEELARLVRRFAPAVYRLAYVRTGQTADAEDVMQETFLRLLTKAPDFQDDDHARSWLLRVAANRAKDLWRSPWSKRLPLETAEELPAPEPEPEPGEALRAVLELPETYRLVTHLFYCEELSVAQIAQILRLSPGAVKTRLSRSRALLRERLKEGDEDCVSQ